MLWKIAETAFGAGHYNASVSAIKELNQLAGLSVNRSQNININADLNTMSKDDIKERLSKLLGAEAAEPSSKDF
jgi:LysM repeat protein